MSLSAGGQDPNFADVDASSPTFRSAFGSLYDAIVTKRPSAADAVAVASAFEEQRDLEVPNVYVSTAITSAGYKRDRTLDEREVITRNGRAAEQVMTALEAYSAPRIRPATVMVPTELGWVKPWLDSDYLIFYFSWLSGLSAEGARWVAAQLAEPVYEPILRVTDDRSRSNEERWPSYRVFTEILLANLALAEARPGGKRSDGATVLLQLIDVDESLGCRAERLYAEARGLDRHAPTFAEDLTGPLGEEVGVLRGLGAEVGAQRQPVELVPLLSA